LSEALPKFVLISSLTATCFDDGTVSISRKFVSGVMEHQKQWPGDVLVVMAPATDDGNNLDYVRLPKEQLPFALEVFSLRDPAIKDVLRGATMVFMMLYHLQFHLANICRELGVPFIYTSEYTLRTRLQIIDSEGYSPWKRMLKALLERYREKRAKSIVKLASGIQSNGLPTYSEYSRLNPNTMLFFDTRIASGMLADNAALSRRFEQRRKTGTLRLAFSGRLIKMKGTDHLVRVASALKKAGTNFTMSICGDGDLRESMQGDVLAHGLEENVVFKGVMNFETELVPFVRDNVDIFVCCHRQGDPSCTYLETMSCGVPIAGYANEAFVGLQAESSVGWIAPMDDPEALAMQLVSLSDREIEEQSLQALEFASRHTFENEFSRRMAHVRQLAMLD
jgi:glycosyltransferase involved in cell wall biosynthesis